MTEAATPPKKRKFTTRSRTGCRTCRIRRIRCDKTPGSCKNCISAGWKCEGLDFNRPRRPGLLEDVPSPCLIQITNSLRGETPDERRGFAFFCSSTVPKINGLFDSPLWNSFILPLGHVENAVSHAVVGLSALHEDLESRGVPRAREDLSRHRHRFALDQYIRALSALNARRHSQDPRLREVILACCLLFVVYELLRGQYELAFAHLQQGLSILQDKKSRESRSPESSISNDSVLFQIMMRLDAQSVFFDVKRPSSSSLNSLDDMNPYPIDIFKSLAEARTALDCLLSTTFCFISVVNSLPPAERFSSCHPDLGDKRKRLFSLFGQYLRQLDRSKGHFQREKEKLGVELLYLHHKTLLMLLHTNFDRDPHCDHHHDFKAILYMSYMSNRVFKRFSQDRSPLPTLLLDMGIIPPLFYLCSDCHDPEIRQDALRILESWPHHEGPWDSRLVVFFVKHLMSIESDGVAAIDSAEPSQVEDAFLHIEDDQESGVIRYRHRSSGSLPSKEKHIKIDDI